MAGRISFDLLRASDERCAQLLLAVTVLTLQHNCAAKYLNQILMCICVCMCVRIFVSVSVCVPYVFFCACVCVCVRMVRCVCVCVRERETHRENSSFDLMYIVF